MSENIITIGLEVDSSQVNTELDAIQKKADAVTKKWADDHRAILTSMSKVGRAITAGINAYRRVLRALNISLDPAQEAILTLIVSSVSSMYQIALAFSSTGIGIVAGAIFAAAATGLNIGATAAYLQDMSRSRQAMDDALAAVASIADFATAIGRI